MHPSLSVIFFTTASGAGYGLLALLGVLAPAGALPQERGFGLASLVLALAAITAGLVSSMFHLGQPQRAWRAFSQWRTSWLSREGVCSLATYAPALLLAVAWVLFGTVPLVFGLLATLGALCTVYCTAMIYRSLKPVPRWHNGWVVPNYFALALMTGALWLVLLLQAFDGVRPAISWLAIAAIIVAALLKLGYWRFIDGSSPSSTAETATGLGPLGTVRLFEAPHTSSNYLLREMGFVIARKHATKLRRLVLTLGFGLPVLLSLVPLVAGGWLAIGATLFAAVLATIGTFVERWLFFAEAKHAVTLYYGGTLA